MAETPQPHPQSPVLPWLLVAVCACGLVASQYEARVARMEERTAALQSLVTTLQERAPVPQPVQIIQVPVPALSPTPAQTQPAAPEKSETNTPPVAKKDMEASRPAAAVASTPPAATPVGERQDQAAPAPQIAPAPETTSPTLLAEVEDTEALEARTETLVQPQGACQARVLLTQPRQRRVMIDVGTEKNVSSGTRFTLWRDGMYVGEARVKKAFARMSACEVTAAVGAGLRVGDAAVQVDTTLALRNDD